MKGSLQISWSCSLKREHWHRFCSSHVQQGSHRTCRHRETAGSLWALQEECGCSPSRWMRVSYLFLAWIYQVATFPCQHTFGLAHLESYDVILYDDVIIFISTFNEDSWQISELEYLLFNVSKIQPMWCRLHLYKTAHWGELLGIFFKALMLLNYFSIKTMEEEKLVQYLSKYYHANF